MSPSKVTVRWRSGRAVAYCIAVLALLAACAGPGARPSSPQAQANAETAAACRQRADEMYNLRHRDTIYGGPSQVNTPFSANYQPGVPDRGLSQVFERDTMVSDCERNIGSEGDRTPQQGASSPVPFATRPPADLAPPPPDLGARP